jgi:N-acetylneuraminic acid mutarotase
MKHTKTITIALILGLITFWGCEDTTDPEENNDLPEILSLTFVQSTPCNSRYGASAVSYENEIYLIGGTNYPTYFTTIEKLDETNNQWTELNEQVIGRRYLTAEVVNGVIYIIGGQVSDGSYVETVQSYNITNNSITTVAPLPTKRKQLNSVVYGNKIYVIGGQLENDGAMTNVVEVYNPSVDLWTTLSPMPTARECDVALIEDKIYAFGGYNGSTSLTTVEIYDIENDSWTTANDMPYALSAYHLASFENFVFLFGDYSAHIDEVNMFNANDDSWIKLSTNFTGRRHTAVVRNGDWIYVIGGYDGNTVFDTVEKCKPYE